jgi:ornithine cyclodeaminase
VVTGQVPGRRPDSGVVYYNSVGLGVQDAAAALAIVSAAGGTD